jgi:hypothetical protein
MIGVAEARLLGKLQPRQPSEQGFQRYLEFAAPVVRRSEMDADRTKRSSGRACWIEDASRESGRVVVGHAEQRDPVAGPGEIPGVTSISS